MKTMFKVFWPVIALLAMNACRKDIEKQAIPAPVTPEANKTVYINDDLGRFYTANATTGLVKWWYNTATTHGSGLTSAVANLEYAVFHDNANGALFCVRNDDGTLAWRQDGVFTYSGICSPLIAEDRLYVPYLDKIRVYRLADGELLKEINDRWGPHSLNYVNGLLIYNTCDGYLVALTADGTERWEYRSNNGCYHNNPAIANGKIYIMSSSGKLSAVDAATGNELWNKDVSAYTFETPLVYGNGLLFAMDAINADRIYAFDAGSGEMVRHYTFPADHYGFYYHAPAVSGDKLYFLTMDGSLVCYSVSGGNLLWHYPLITIEGRKPATTGRKAHMRLNRNEGLQFVTSPVIANDWLYAAAGNTLFAMDLNGRIKWELPTTGSLYDAPAILSNDGRLYRCGMAGVAEQ